MRVALITEVFPTPADDENLRQHLREAKSQGAELAVLPELPLNRWCPATKEARDDDAEPSGGERHARLAQAARDVGIALVGGAIVRARDGRRTNTALVFDANGEHLGSYSKVHIPDEPGYWESDHYEPGLDPPQVIEGLELPLGVQICSDINRPQGCHLLGALGAELVVAPRATEPDNYVRWKPVFIANALTSCTYVLSPNRPRSEGGVPIGGPTIAVSPRGEVLAETSDPICVVDVSHEVVVDARGRYPGYLAQPASMYHEGWSRARDQAARPRPYDA